MRQPGPCRNWGCPELYLGNMLFSGSCPRAALLDFPGGKSSPWQGPCCLPSPPGAAGLLFLGPTPEQALASHPSGLFVTTGPVTLPAAGIQKLSLNKLCLLALCQHDMFPEICLEEGFFCTIPVGAGGPTTLPSSFPPAVPASPTSWLALTGSLRCTRINPLYLCKGGNFVHTQASVFLNFH